MRSGSAMPFPSRTLTATPSMARDMTAFPTVRETRSRTCSTGSPLLSNTDVVLEKRDIANMEAIGPNMGEFNLMESHLYLPVLVLIYLKKRYTRSAARMIIKYQ